MIDKHVLLPNEARLQLIADGMISISIPETVEGGDEFPVPTPFGNNYSSDKTSGKQTQERPGLLGSPIAPSQGGQGEVRNSLLDANILDDVDNLDDNKQNS